MKKLINIILVASMVLAMGVTAFANDTNDGISLMIEQEISETITAGGGGVDGATDYVPPCILPR